MLPGHTGLAIATHEPVSSLKGSCTHFSVEAGLTPKRL